MTDEAYEVIRDRIALRICMECHPPVCPKACRGCKDEAEAAMAQVVEELTFNLVMEIDGVKVDKRIPMFIAAMFTEEYDDDED